MAWPITRCYAPHVPNHFRSLPHHNSWLCCARGPHGSLTPSCGPLRPAPRLQGLLRFAPDLGAGSGDVQSLSSQVRQLLRSVKVEPGGLLGALRGEVAPEDDGLGGSSGDQ
jgi:hypothetical protein